METNKSCHKINIENVQTEPDQQQGYKENDKEAKYSLDKNIEDKKPMKVDKCDTIDLLIPEINFEAPTPKCPSPCISPKTNEKFFPPAREFVLKYNEEEELTKSKSKDKKNFIISDEDWDRMEALAEEERLQNEEIDVPEVSQEEINENRRKLREFRENPNKVDISKSKLAEELKFILEEATKRVEEGYFPEKRLNPNKKERKKRPKVKFENKKPSIINPNPEEAAQMSQVQDMITKVETKLSSDHVNNIEVMDDDIDDEGLLNGFMDGYEAEEEDLGVGTIGVDKSVVIKVGVACLVAFGAAILINRIRQ